MASLRKCATNRPEHELRTGVGSSRRRGGLRRGAGAVVVREVAQNVGVSSRNKREAAKEPRKKRARSMQDAERTALHARRIRDYGQCGMWGERRGVVGRHGVRRLGSGLCAGAKPDRFHNYPGRPRSRRGGTQGIGEGIACRFTQAGAEVCILGLNDGKGNLAGEQARCCPEHHFINADLSLFQRPSALLTTSVHAQAPRDLLTRHVSRFMCSAQRSCRGSCLACYSRDSLIMDTLTDAGVALDADVQPDLEEGQLTRRRPLRAGVEVGAEVGIGIGIGFELGLVQVRISYV
ncbi:hypothetical protein JB92DRAFT_3101055 [Gautieria morchelliformis]|nr:hypothetical protein JB92DRAFT_3101055 [Gautieria morchelliformis]